ncbi:hypothetical protein [Thermobifida cellulosilytica]|uniref:hypothetical protein n=1 Tax=Thermobifida cellulosilytica TaxID=144786 RepID=UPI0012EE0FFA|nr:hypothetical protein [Thermobifida cellulosilytica]
MLSELLGDQMSAERSGRVSAPGKPPVEGAVGDDGAPKPYSGLPGVDDSSGTSNR